MWFTLRKNLFPKCVGLNPIPLFEISRPFPIWRGSPSTPVRPTIKIGRRTEAPKADQVINRLCFLSILYWYGGGLWEYGGVHAFAYQSLIYMGFCIFRKGTGGDRADGTYVFTSMSPSGRWYLKPPPWAHAVHISQRRQYSFVKVYV